MLRGLWWRRGLTAAVVIVAAITTMSAALGPMYARAAGESTLRDQLAAAPVTATGLHYQATTDVTSAYDYRSVLDQGPRPGKIAGYPTRIGGIFLPTGATGAGGSVDTDLLWRQGICGHVVITSGGVPDQIPDSSWSRPGRWPQASTAGALARSSRWTDSRSTGVDATGFPIAQPAYGVIVGTYRPVNTADPFWFGQNYFDAHVGRKSDTVDSVIVDPAEFHSLTAPTNAEVDVDLPLDLHAVRWSVVPALQRGGRQPEDAVLAERRQLPHQRGSRHQAGSSPADAGLHRDDPGHPATRAAGLARAVPGRLRHGRGPWQRDRAGQGARGAGHSRRCGSGWPSLWCCYCWPSRSGSRSRSAWCTCSRRRCWPPVLLWVVPAGAVLAAFVAFAGGVLAALLAAQRTLTRSALEQWQRTTSHVGQSRLALVVDVLSAAAAVAALVVLRHRHHTGTGNDSAALLAPGLLVAAVALLGVRLLPPLCRALVPATRATHRVGLFLALRQVSRRPTGLRLASLLAIALGLATFAVAGESVALAKPLRPGEGGAGCRAGGVRAVQRGRQSGGGGGQGRPGRTLGPGRRDVAAGRGRFGRRAGTRGGRPPACGRRSARGREVPTSPRSDARSPQPRSRP